MHIFIFRTRYCDIVKIVVVVYMQHNKMEKFIKYARKSTFKCREKVIEYYELS